MSRRLPGRTRGFQLPRFGELGASFGLLLLVLYPVIGNALTYGTRLPRRPFQAAALAAAFLTLWASRRWLTARMIPGDAIRRLTDGRGFRVGLGLLLSLIVVEAVGNTRAFGADFPARSVVELLMFVPWLAFAWLVLVVLGPAALRRPASARGQSTPRPVAGLLRWFGPVAFLLGMIMVAREWYIGPPFLQVFLSFGGSTIIAGLAATITAFILLACTSFPLSLLWSLPYAFIVVMATSRAVWIGSALLYVIYVVWALQEGRSLPGKLCRAALPVVVWWFVLVRPIDAHSCVYPFIVPRCNEALATYRANEFALRAYRMIRLVPAPIRKRWTDRMKASLGLAGKTDQELIDAHYRLQLALTKLYAEGGEGLIGEDGRPITAFADAQARLMVILSQGGDSRYDLYQRAVQMVRERPMGYWPVPFKKTVNLDCGDKDGEGC